MALFFAQRVLLGKLEFDKIPKPFKMEVGKLLVETGFPDLVSEEYLPADES